MALNTFMTSSRSSTLALESELIPRSFLLTPQVVPACWPRLTTLFIFIIIPPLSDSTIEQSTYIAYPSKSLTCKQSRLTSVGRGDHVSTVMLRNRRMEPSRSGRTRIIEARYRHHILFPSPLTSAVHNCSPLPLHALPLPPIFPDQLSSIFIFKVYRIQHWSFDREPNSGDY